MTDPLGLQDPVQVQLLFLSEYSICAEISIEMSSSTNISLTGLTVELEVPTSLSWEIEI